MQSYKARRLYDEANSVQTAPEVVKELANVKGTNVQILLLSLAESPSANVANRQEAISQLANSKDPEIAIRLSELLQPYQPLALQDEVGRSLTRLKCRTPCIGNVLHYLEREYWGEHNEMQDRTIVSEPLRKIQNSINENLSMVLSSNGADTLNELLTVYGFGSSQPSKYAVTLVMNVELTNACPLLLKSQRLMQQYESLGLDWKAPVEEAVQRLNCHKT